MVGRRPSSQTQSKTTQGGGGRARQDSGRNYEGAKMGKKQIVKKNQMKVKQAEEKLIFYFFFLF